MPEEAPADPGFAERCPQPCRVGRGQLEALNQEAAGFLGAHLRRLLNVGVHDLGQRGGVDRVLIGGINFGSHASHHGADNVGWQHGMPSKASMRWASEDFPTRGAPPTR